MGEKLKSYLNVLELDGIDKVIFEEALLFLHKLSGNTSAIDDNKDDVALVFYRLLKDCGQVYSEELKKKRDGLPKDVKKRILDIFVNIEHIGLNLNEFYKDSIKETDESHQKPYSQMYMIWFLSELRSRALDNQVLKMQIDTLTRCIDELLDILEDISFIFDFQDDNQSIFPIHQLVATAINDVDFISGKKGVSRENLRILQLAVRLFKNLPQEALLTNLEERCNLRFIKYLSSDCTIIDSYELDNYQRNQVMIFYNTDPANRGLLIRNEERSYFCAGYYGSCNKNLKISQEKDNNGIPIGWFVEIPLEPGDKLIDYSEAFKKPEYREKFLRLLFDHKCLNVFMEQALLLKRDGTLLPTNPFCANDNTLIKCRLNNMDKTPVICSSEQLLRLITEYRTSYIHTDNMLNRISFGLCCQLLMICNIGVDGLKLSELNSNDWYQSQVVNTWIQDDRIGEEHVCQFLGMWYDQLAYCETGRKGVEGYRLKPQDFFPFRQALDCIYQKICPEITDDEQVYHGRVKDDNGLYIDVILQDTVASERRRSEGVLTICKEDIRDGDEDFIWEEEIDNDVFFLFSPSKKQGHFANQNELKYLAQIERIMKTSIPYSLYKEISEKDYQDVKMKIKLFQESFKEVAERTKVSSKEDIDTQVFIRLLHNIIWSQLHVNDEDESKINKYFSIIRAHQIANFSNIKNNKIFQRNAVGTLYIPKDREKQASVLHDVYETYLRNKATREKRSLYDQDLTISNDGKYSINNEEIKDIVFLTDNFVGGHATMRALVQYLSISPSDEDIELKNFFKENKLKTDLKKYGGKDLLKITCGEETVKVSDIIAKNKHICISVYGYYGTDEGCKAIDNLLDLAKVYHKGTGYAYKLSSKAEDAYDASKLIWKGRNSLEADRNTWLFIREFNMPKKSVFPDAMLDNPDLAICLFVRKKENRY